MSFIFSWNWTGRELNQPRRRRDQKHHRFAYLTMKNDRFARLARSLFNCTFSIRSRSMTWNDPLCSCVNHVVARRPIFMFSINCTWSLNFGEMHVVHVAGALHLFLFLFSFFRKFGHFFRPQNFENAEHIFVSRPSHNSIHIPEDSFGPLIWPPWRHEKTIYSPLTV